MMNLCSNVLNRLKGRTLSTAESCTGGGIGAALTAVPGSSTVYKGGIISYCDEVKADVLGVDSIILEKFGAVSHSVAKEMAVNARKTFSTDIAISVTGLAGPDPDESGQPVGTVFIGYASDSYTYVRHFLFIGDREAVRKQATIEALRLILEIFVENE